MSETVFSLKLMLKKIMHKFAQVTFEVMYDRIIEDIENSRAKETQLILYHTYRSLLNREITNLPTLNEVGFRCHSQFEEDGILLYLFAILGTTNRKCVEICAGNGKECNTANLILNHGWWGYLFDGNEANVSTGKKFFQQSRDTWLHPPQFCHAWINAENINDVILGSGVEGDVDLLSLDIDGMDYWVWKAIDCIKPRIVVCEVQNVIDPNHALTIPYDPNFKISIPDYHSASLAAMTKLANQKGYRLVGTNKYGFNAFYVLNGLGEAYIPTIDPTQCQQDPYSLKARAERWPKVKDQNWMEV